MTQSWPDVLDSLSCQLDRQERALLHGHTTPPDLEVDPPAAQLREHDRLRAMELLERCETLLDVVVERIAASRRPDSSPYRRLP